MWTLDYEADIASDLSAFHRIDDPMTIPGPRYFSLALRLAAYAGVIRARVVAEREEAEGRGSGAHSAAGGRTAADSRPSVVSDGALIGMLASDGNAEYVTEEG